MRFFKIDQLIDSLNGDQGAYIEPQKKFANDGINAYFLDNFVSFLFCISSAYLSYYACKYGSQILYNYRNRDMNNSLKNKTILSVR